MGARLKEHQDYPLKQLFLSGYCTQCGNLRAVCEPKYIREKDMSVIRWEGDSGNQKATQLGVDMSVEKINVVINGREVVRWRWVFGDRSGLERKKPESVNIINELYNKLRCSQD
jgi:hypothetical protein